MSEAVSCGGVVIFRGKVLVLYKNFMNSRDGWVLPKGTVEKGETYEQTAVREVNEEAGADVGDLVRTIIVDSTVTCRMKRTDVINNSWR